ncbi:hypothetical protein AB0F81_30995 [Actinoplanes sp. NPDC024001]|uniref:hypothetical protein n=1 Tax=Actinoplanes sp. NPDC024001 TaxID=3154598 RepID=UPI0033C264D7
MPNRIGLLAAAGTVVMVSSACGGADPAPAWVAPSEAAPAAESPAPPARPKQITSACDLLAATVVIDLLGGSERTRLAAKELPAEEGPNGNVWRHCAYGRDGKQPFALSVATMPNRSDTVEETIDAVAKAGEKSVRIKDLGAAAVGYVEGGSRAVMAVVPYQNELRVVQFTGPTVVPRDKLADTVRHVLAKI